MSCRALFRGVVRRYNVTTRCKNKCHKCESHTPPPAVVVAHALFFPNTGVLQTRVCERRVCERRVCGGVGSMVKIPF